MLCSLKSKMPINWRQSTFQNASVITCCDTWRVPTWYPQRYKRIFSKMWLRSWSLVKPFGCRLFGFMWGWSGVWVLLPTPRALMAFRRNMLRESFTFQRVQPSLAENSVKRRLLAGLFFQFCDILAKFLEEFFSKV